MKLLIDAREVQARAGQSLLEIVRELGLDSGELSARPLVAKIAGEVFSLNYPRAKATGTLQQIR